MCAYLLPLPGRLHNSKVKPNNRAVLQTEQHTAPTDRQLGTMRMFNCERGYGFIQPQAGGDDIFVHASSVIGTDKILARGDLVEFGIGPGRKGPAAIDVALVTRQR